MTSKSVLRFGPSSASTNVIKNALIAHFTDQEDVGSGSNEVVLSNRYFTANVVLAEASMDTDGQEDGMILVFDALQANPDLTTDTTPSSLFDNLTKVHEAAVELNRCGDLLRLCVGVHLGELSPEELRGKNHEEEYSRRVLWCLDRGYEYVEADMSDEGRQKGHEERDKEGYARIIEAMAGTVWSSAQMGKTKQQKLKQERQQVQKQVEEESQTHGDEGKEEKRESLSSSENPFSLEETKEELNGGYLEVATTEEETQRRLREREEENMFDSLEGLMRQASRIREMSRSGELTDEQRRQRAGDAATLMMDLMTKLELADGEETDDIDEDDDE